MDKKYIKSEKPPYSRKIGNTTYIISTHFSGNKNILQKLGEMMLRDYQDGKAK